MTNDAGALWELLGGDAGCLESLSLSGDVWFASPFDVTGFARDAVAVATLGAAELHAVRDGRPMARVTVDSLEACAAFRSEALFEAVGWERPPIWDPIAGDYRARDRYVRLHTNYASHRRAVEKVLAIGEGTATREAVQSAVASMRGAELERAVVEAGGCAAVMYTREEWLTHEHGSVAKDEVPYSRIAYDGGAIPLAGLPRDVQGRAARPFDGVRVLDLTRVLAGPVCTRFLAAHGAEVLRIDPPWFEEVPAVVPDTTVGKRCAFLALDTEEGKATFAGLLARADVLVHGLRPGALEGLGFGAERLRRDYPSLVTAEVCAYGFHGPWRGRRGFDSLVQMSVGIAAHRGGADEKPAPLPAQALDHGAGYLLAAGVARALTCRVKHGHASAVHTSLVGVANHLQARPLGVALAKAPTFPETAVTVEPTAWGAARRVPCPGRIGGARGTWDIPAGPLGTSAPAFR